MLRQFIQFRKWLFDQGFLDNQFTQLQLLQDQSSPDDFVVEVASLFFNDCGRILNDLSVSLNGRNVDFRRIDAYVHQLKGSSSSVGALRVKNACITLRNFCDLENVQLCKACVQLVRQEVCSIREYLKKLLKMEKLILSAGGSIPPM